MPTLFLILVILFALLSVGMVCRAVYTYRSSPAEQKPWYWLYLLYALAWALFAAWYYYEISEFPHSEQSRTVIIACAATLNLLVALLASRMKQAQTQPGRKSWWM